MHAFRQTGVRNADRGAAVTHMGCIREQAKALRASAINIGAVAPYLVGTTSGVAVITTWTRSNAKLMIPWATFESLSDEAAVTLVERAIMEDGSRSLAGFVLHRPELKDASSSLALTGIVTTITVDLLTEDPNPANVAAEPLSPNDNRAVQAAPFVMDIMPARVGEETKGPTGVLGLSGFTDRNVKLFGAGTLQSVAQDASLALLIVQGSINRRLLFEYATSHRPLTDAELGGKQAEFSYSSSAATVDGSGLYLV